MLRLATLRFFNRNLEDLLWIIENHCVMIVENAKRRVSVDGSKHIRNILCNLMCVAILLSILTVTPQKVFCEVGPGNSASQSISSITNDFTFIGIVNTEEEPISTNLQKNYSPNRLNLNVTRLLRIVFSFCIKILILFATFSGSHLVLSLSTTRSQKIIIQYIQSVNGQ